MNLGIYEANNLGIIDVAPAKAHCLNQSTLWQALKFNQSHTLIRSTGCKEQFTAVIPVKAWNNEEVWTAFTKTTKLSEFMISAQLRGTLNPIPTDYSAFVCATFLK